MNDAKETTVFVEEVTGWDGTDGNSPIPEDGRFPSEGPHWFVTLHGEDLEGNALVVRARLREEAVKQLKSLLS